MPEAIRYADAILEIKAIDDDSRTFEGIASTPTVDFGGDIMEPFGAKFSLPLPFMWQHGKEDIKDPIGWITHATPTAAGIKVRGRFDDGKGAPPSLKEQIDRAFYLVKKRLVTGLSIGWRPVEGKPEKGNPGVVRWTKWLWHELSAVRIGMNSDATITAVKSMNRELRAASPGGMSQKSPEASGKSSQSAGVAKMKGIPEQIAAMESERAKTKARIDELSTKCAGDPDELEAAEKQELDDLGQTLIETDTKLRRLHTMADSISKSVPVLHSAGLDPDRASRVRAGDFVERSNLPKGTRWTRSVMAKAFAIRNNRSVEFAADLAKRTWPDTPEVAEYIKANPGTGASGNWAEPLNTSNTIEGEFIDLLYPATIVGKLGLRPATFNTKMLRRTTGFSAANWVGNAAAKPVGENAWDTVEIKQNKIAGIVVLTDDQINTSHIDNVEAVRRDLIEQISMFADEQFTDPLVAAGTNNPASILNGVNDIPSNGATADDLRADLYALLNRFGAANIPLSSVTLVMSSFLASGISMLTNALGNAEFPDITVEGGRLRGLRVIVSNNVGGSSSGSNLIGVAASEVMLAQRGGVMVDMSRDATIDMAGGNSPTFSLFQKNAVALRAEWWVSWAKRRAEAAQYVSGAAYAPQPAA